MKDRIRYSQNIDPTEGMEAPCMCDCGRWFDLDDGWSSRNSNHLVCGHCHKEEAEIEEVENELSDLDHQLAMEMIGKRQYNKLKKELTLKLKNPTNG
jgi:hypothetical protein